MTINNQIKKKIFKRKGKLERIANANLACLKHLILLEVKQHEELI